MKVFPESAYELVKNDLIGEHFIAGRTVRFTITTSSMMPLLAPGDVITVQLVAASALQVGDIVVRPVNRIWLAHRLIAYGETGETRWYETKGDNHYCADQLWQAAEREGVVIAAEYANTVIHLRSAWARRLNRGMALLSCAQARRAHAKRFLDRLVRKTCRLLNWMVATGIRRLAR